MANCINCGAPLSKNSGMCPYCRSMNDVDLMGKVQWADDASDKNRICPRCNCKLGTLDLSENGTLLIERCEKCYGLFFDKGELEEYLDNKVDKAVETDHRTLDRLINENYHKDYPVGYIKCPVCSNLMNRENYGRKSGVVVNHCRDHGLWLDCGMLNHIIGWAKAGGRELEREHREMKLAEEKRCAEMWDEKAIKAYHEKYVQKEMSLADVAKAIMRIMR